MRRRLYVAAGIVLVCLPVALLRPADLALTSTATPGLAPASDTYVDSATPGTAYGAQSQLRVATSPRQDGLLRFAIPSTGTIRSATLRLRNVAGATGGIQAHAIRGGFTEATTWRNAPIIDAALIARSGPFTAGGTASLDLTALARPGASLSVAVTSTGGETDFGARESSTPPQLVISWAVTPSPTPRPTATPAPPPQQAGIRVSGNTLLRDGTPFTPLGFNMIGLLTPPGCGNGGGQTAHAHLNQAEMTAAAAGGANTLRFQISQSGLVGPQSSNYMNEVNAGVTLARQNGFVVILSMQDQSIGCGSAHPLPSAQTVAAWRVLAPAFANHRDVIFELFNEPTNTTTPAAWAQWKNGGSTPEPNQGAAAVGHQSLLGLIRSLGANNVVLADGADHAERLQGIPMLADTKSGLGVAYAVHPYYYTPGATFWQAQYGYLTTTVPVVATEWNYHAADCGTPAETIAPGFLAYLKQHHIGMTAHAFDVPGILTTGWNFTPTACGTSYGGPGRLLEAWFHSH